MAVVARGAGGMPDDPAQHRSDHHAATIQDLREIGCAVPAADRRARPAALVGSGNSLELAAQCRGVLKPGAPRPAAQ